LADGLFERIAGRQGAHAAAEESEPSEGNEDAGEAARLARGKLAGVWWLALQCGGDRTARESTPFAGGGGGRCWLLYSGGGVPPAHSGRMGCVGQEFNRLRVFRSAGSEKVAGAEINGSEWLTGRCAWIIGCILGKMIQLSDCGSTGNDGRSRWGGGYSARLTVFRRLGATATEGLFRNLILFWYLRRRPIEVTVCRQVKVDIGCGAREQVLF
jgi:hypothetical protein